MDRLTKEQRHKNMLANKSRGTKIELILAKVLWNAGIRYRKNDKGVHGTPDFTLRGYRIAIFCDGEFWHGRDWETNKEKIKSNRKFWYAKIERNIERDREITRQLESEGWKVFRFWETDIRREPDTCVSEVLAYMQAESARRSKIQLSSIRLGNRIPLQYCPDTLPFTQSMAVVSHFLHNRNQLAAKTFEVPASKIISHLYDINEQEGDMGQLIAEPEIQYSLGSNLVTAPFLPPSDPTFTFIDLFAGIGGSRLALQRLGGKCVFCSEGDVLAQLTYLLNFGELPFGDLWQLSTRQLIPESFDILCATLPCQCFSLISKKSDFDRTRGTRFHSVATILRERQPKAFILETGKKIFTLQKGKTLETLLKILRETLGYEVPQPVNVYAYEFGLPHDSQRVYIVGFRQDLKKKEVNNDTAFHYPVSSDANSKLEDFEQKTPVDSRYYLSQEMMSTLKMRKDATTNHAKKWPYEAVAHYDILHVLQGESIRHDHNFVIDYRLYDSNRSTPYRGNRNNDGIRRLTPRELARLQGYPENFILDVKDKVAYQLLEKATIVNIAEAIAKEVVRLLLRLS